MSGGAFSGYLSTFFFFGLTLGRLVFIPLNRRLGEKLVTYIYTSVAIGMEVVFWLVPSLVGNAIVSGRSLRVRSRTHVRMSLTLSRRDLRTGRVLCRTVHRSAVPVSDIGDDQAAAEESALGRARLGRNVRLPRFTLSARPLIELTLTD